jgi:hypothetical protein
MPGSKALRREPFRPWKKRPKAALDGDPYFSVMLSEAKYLMPLQPRLIAIKVLS